MEVEYVLNSEDNQPLPPKIPRPANAFMIYANKNRKQMSMLHPQESNKEISKRLGLSWKALDTAEKKKYFDEAKTVDAEHKRKYPDYVYNPKEARIRKAMREASRERVVGTAPIPSPRGGRRSQTWTNNPEEQLMMAPSTELGGSLCGSSIFAGPTSSVGQFMQPLNGYTKLVHVLPPSSWIQDSPTYLQHNPIAELQQHQANMWQQYQDPIRHCTGPTYMLDNQINIYQDAKPTDMSTQKKCKSEVDVYSSSISNASAEAALTQCKSKGENFVKNEKIDENSDRIDNDHETLAVNSRGGDATEQPPLEKFCPVTFQETVVVQNPFDKDDDNNAKLKKISSSECKSFSSPSSTSSTTAPPSASSSESENSIHKRSCKLCLHNKDKHINGNSCVPFPYSVPIVHDHCNVNMVFVNNCNPNLIYTDIGVIPMYDINTDIERLLNNSTSVNKINEMEVQRK